MLFFNIKLVISYNLLQFINAFISFHFLNISLYNIVLSRERSLLLDLWHNNPVKYVFFSYFFQETKLNLKFQKIKKLNIFHVLFLILFYILINNNIEKVNNQLGIVLNNKQLNYLNRKINNQARMVSNIIFRLILIINNYPIVIMLMDFLIFFIWFIILLKEKHLLNRIKISLFFYFLIMIILLSYKDKNDYEYKLLSFVSFFNLLFIYSSIETNFSLGQF